MRMLNTSKLRYLREMRGWDQKDLANAADIAPSVISRLERGLQQDLKLSVAIALSKALEVPIDQLLDEEHQAMPTNVCQELELILNVLNTQPQDIQINTAKLISCYLSLHGKQG